MNGLIEFRWYIVPVVVHIADEHGVEGVEVSAEHSKLIQDEQLSLLIVTFTVSLQQLLFSYNLRLWSIAFSERPHTQPYERKPEPSLTNGQMCFILSM